VIVREFRGALSRIDLAVASLEGKVTFGAGPRPGTYFTFGTMLSRFAANTDMPIFSYESAGSVESGRRLQDRSLDFGLLQSDIAEMLYVGSAEEGIFPNRDLRSVASLWPEAVHLVTLEETGIETVHDLRGRRIAIGTRGSGTRVNAVSVGLAAGFEAEEIPRIEEFGLLGGIGALERGDVEALFVSEAIPSPALQALAAKRSDVRFVSLDSTFIHEQSEKELVYYPLTVAARTYPGQEEPFHTLGFACTLVTHQAVSDERVEGLLRLLVDRVEELSALYFRAAFVSDATMRLGIAVPLHPAAERFYDARPEATE
jgi:TRAP transporter TAXI family solute receptor